MASARSVLERLKSSDGRIRIKTLSGVWVLVAVIALLVGVLPVFASHDTSAVDPVQLNEGGGSGKCSVETGGLPSAAGNEYHINNPTLGQHTSADGVIRVNVYDTPPGETPAGTMFSFEVLNADFVVYDVIVNGGPKSNHYDYDANGETVSSDQDLHAPHKNPNSLHNLSHINICYDVPGIIFFACADDPVKLESEGLFTVAEASIFANSVWDCTDDKRASFFIDNTTEGADPSVTLAFHGDTGLKVAGRLDLTKEFGDPDLFVDLTYDRDGSGAIFVPVPWCNIRAFATGDGTQFDEWLTTGEGGSYPELPEEETACKVAENEDLSGTQVTVMYFELEDPQWR